MLKLKDNIKLLNHLEKKGSIALIETDKIEYLDKDNNWIKLSTLDLLHIPVELYATSKLDEDNKIISYTLHYHLLITDQNIEPLKTETLNLVIEDEDCEKEYKKIDNEEYDRSYLRYDNSNINTFSKIVNIETINLYLRRNRRKLYKATNTINENIKNQKIK